MIILRVSVNSIQWCMRCFAKASKLHTHAYRQMHRYRQKIFLPLSTVLICWHVDIFINKLAAWLYLTGFVPDILMISIKLTCLLFLCGFFYFMIYLVIFENDQLTHPFHQPFELGIIKCYSGSSLSHLPSVLLISTPFLSSQT